jgi:hypothetical protein
VGRVNWTITDDEAVEDAQGSLYYRAKDHKGRPGRVYYYEADDWSGATESFVVEEFKYTRWERLLQRVGIYGMPRSEMVGAVLGGVAFVTIIGGALGATLLPDPYGTIFVYASIAVGIMWLVAVAFIVVAYGFDKLARMLGYTRAGR